MQPSELKTNRINRIREPLIQWYRMHHRRLPWRETADPYAIWVSEVMLQQTQVNTVLPYYADFMARFPDIESLAEADPQEVLKVWEGLGYYARARNLHKAARVVVTEYRGKIPDDWDTFKSLPGVGEYIASAVQSIAFEGRHAVVDGNVKRVLARLLTLDAPANAAPSYTVFKGLATRLLDPSSPGIFNQAMMELGALICRPVNPGCVGCPLRWECRAFQAGSVAEYPRRIKKKPTPTRKLVAGVICRNGELLITRRPTEGLLGGLWEFPGGEILPGEEPSEALIRRIRETTGLAVAVDAYLTRVRHAYTHFKVDLEVFYCRYRSGEIELAGPQDHRWILMNEIEEYPFPKVNRKFIPLIEGGPAQKLLRFRNSG